MLIMILFYFYINIIDFKTEVAFMERTKDSWINNFCPTVYYMCIRFLLLGYYYNICSRYMNSGDYDKDLEYFIPPETRTFV